MERKTHEMNILSKYFGTKVTSNTLLQTSLCNIDLACETILRFLKTTKEDAKKICLNEPNVVTLSKDELKARLQATKSALYTNVENLREVLTHSAVILSSIPSEIKTKTETLHKTLKTPIIHIVEVLKTNDLYKMSTEEITAKINILTSHTEINKKTMLALLKLCPILECSKEEITQNLELYFLLYPEGNILLDYNFFRTSYNENKNKYEFLSAINPSIRLPLITDITYKEIVKRVAYLKRNRPNFPLSLALLPKEKFIKLCLVKRSTETNKDFTNVENCKQNADIETLESEYKKISSEIDKQQDSDIELDLQSNKTNKNDDLLLLEFKNKHQIIPKQIKDEAFPLRIGIRKNVNRTTRLDRAFYTAICRQNLDELLPFTKMHEMRLGIFKTDKDGYNFNKEVATKMLRRHNAKRKNNLIAKQV